MAAPHGDPGFEPPENLGELERRGYARNLPRNHPPWGPDPNTARLRLLRPGILRSWPSSGSAAPPVVGKPNLPSPPRCAGRLVGLPIPAVQDHVLGAETSVKRGTGPGFSAGGIEGWRAVVRGLTAEHPGNNRGLLQ